MNALNGKLHWSLNATGTSSSHDSDFLCGEVIRVNGGSFMI